MKEYKIGEKFSDGVRWYKVEKAKDECEGCCFLGENGCDDTYYSCIAPERIFKRIDTPVQLDKKGDKVVIIACIVLLTVYIIYRIIEKTV